MMMMIIVIIIRLIFPMQKSWKKKKHTLQQTVNH